VRFALLALLLLASCAQRIPVGPPTHAGAGWAAIEQKDGSILVVADDEDTADLAVKELCRKYICIIDYGAARFISRKEK
jgi:hypothetical protein